MTPTDEASAGRPVWWLDPSVITFGFLIPAYLVMWWVGVLTQGTISTAKGFFFLHGPVAWLGLAGLVFFAIGTLSPIIPTVPRCQFPAVFVRSRILSGIGLLALVGYLYWFKDLILNPGYLAQVLKESASFSLSIRETLDRSAGVASLAQLGVPYIILYCHGKWAGRGHALSRLHHVLMVLVLAATLFRAFAWAERLAAVEAAIAIGMVWITFAPLKSKLARIVGFALPIIGLVGVVFFFGIAEYFRSWSSFYVEREDSFVHFVIQRLVNYYFAALNTGAGTLEVFEWPTYEFTTILNWFHKLPVVGTVFQQYVGPLFEGANFLVRFGDPEFNNVSGLFYVFYDVGVPVGFALFAMLGAAGRYYYVAWLRGVSLSGAFYFVFLMSAVEMFRYFYLGDARCFMVVVGLAVASVTARPVVRSHEAQASVGAKSRVPSAQPDIA